VAHLHWLMVLGQHLIQRALGLALARVQLQQPRERVLAQMQLPLALVLAPLRQLVLVWVPQLLVLAQARVQGLVQELPQPA
jgi:hypothetical protein